VGTYNFPNVLAAVATGYHFGVSPAHIKQAIENYAPGNSRSQLVQHGTTKIILDAYNANPGSMRSAITNFAAIPAPNKILILGAMAELGKDSIAEHEAIIKLVDEYEWQAVLLAGGDFLKINHPYHSMVDADEATAWLRQHSYENAYMLVKGSRSMQMEKVMRVFGVSGK
jgi:UDP-N-acetylmuramoyl-tripeptide--D-alanyl-D-alanine ligase